jgi:hypothetical protein
MVMMQFMKIPWDRRDVAGLESQKPSEASFGSVVFDVEMSSNMTKRKWNKFAGLITQAFKLVEYNGTFNITVSIAAVHYESEDTIMNRLRKLKGVMDAMAPVPACWDWTVVIQFEKFPYWNQVEDYMKTVERAIYGKRFNEIERKYRGSIIKFEIAE